MPSSSGCVLDQAVKAGEIPGCNPLHRINLALIAGNWLKTGRILNESLRFLGVLD